ncbi:tyrosine-type recombinase/integrase [Kitasatospora sp. NBC_01266]|uniref:tyrosine-type recombinase/integrase n=1 Tax=Kitasatospora sp. NBC_01266 TaxID=2903572 RepID=UPI002E3575CE|nr:tyrosine-type recombinase/integrase [Kitasatospora sp. NBC_01266]
MEEFRSFLVKLPSGINYWTVLDAGLRPVVAADEFLINARLGRDLAESTTRAYATSIALYLRWCARIEMGWPQATVRLGRFVHWLQHDAGDGENLVVLVRPVRGARRVNCVLSAVREFIRFAVSTGLADSAALEPLYDLVPVWDLPPELRGEGQTRWRSRARHRLREAESLVDAASPEEILGLLRACRNARDRFIIVALWRMGLRRGELTGVRREDVHFLADASRLGCGIAAAHLHVRRRENVNGAAAKSRRHRPIPADWLVVQAYDRFMAERDACRQAQGCDFLLVNLFRAPLGAPMRPQALNELLEALSRRAELERGVHPHMARHAFGSGVVAAGATLDEFKELMGHASFASGEPYLHPDPRRLRAAVESVPLPREIPSEVNW